MNLDSIPSLFFRALWASSERHPKLDAAILAADEMTLKGLRCLRRCFTSTDSRA